MRLPNVAIVSVRGIGSNKEDAGTEGAKTKCMISVAIETALRAKGEGDGDSEATLDSRPPGVSLMQPTREEQLAWNTSKGAKKKAKEGTNCDANLAGTNCDAEHSGESAKTIGKGTLIW